MASHVEQLMETSAAEWDYRFKLQARRVDRLRQRLADLTAVEGAHTEPPRDPPA
jgi:hypothetical protein